MKRAIALCLTFATVMALLVVASSNADAATACRPVTKHWSIKEGSVPIKIGWVELRIEVCTNGGAITTSSRASDHDTSGPGTAAGFVIGTGNAYRTSFNSGGFGGGSTSFAANGTTRDCLPGGITIVCSYTGNWQVTGTVRMLNALVIGATGPNQFVLNGRVFAVTWSAKCTNRVCKSRFA